eukprot:TRINITY_DN7136_c0_g1_i4.p1 TRINITY_DN7136_c0_g1~~TRINITY_DN7136_c0_g1_i4.p1  ORF type:complete len:617 (+),score=133.14 TRINITY_DN7136_c0_g1_i4:296-2146(+)
MGSNTNVHNEMGSMNASNGASTSKFDLMYTNSPLLPPNLSHSSPSNFIVPWNSLNDYYASSPSLLPSHAHASLSASSSPRILSSSSSSFPNTPTYFSPLSTPNMVPSSSPSIPPSSGRSKKKRGIQWDQMEKDPRLLAAEQMKQRQIQNEKRERQIKEIRETLSVFRSGGNQYKDRNELLNLIREYMNGDVPLKMFISKLRSFLHSDLFEWIVKLFIDGPSDTNMVIFLGESGVTRTELGLPPLSPPKSKKKLEKKDDAKKIEVNRLPDRTVDVNDMNDNSNELFSPPNQRGSGSSSSSTSASPNVHPLPPPSKFSLAKSDDIDEDDYEDIDDVDEELGNMNVGEKDEQDTKRSRSNSGSKMGKGLRSPPNKWTKAESQQLIVLVSQHGERQWKKIAEELGGGKTGAQCAQHWKRVLSPEIRKGSWDDKEEELLFQLVSKHGQSWKNVASEIKTRTDIQCRYQYFKACMSREVLWTPQEEDILLKKLQQIVSEMPPSAATPDGRPQLPPISWVEITRYMQRMKMTKIPRTALECKQRFYSLPPSRQSVVFQPLSGPSSHLDPSSPLAFQQQMFVLPMQSGSVYASSPLLHHQASYFHFPNPSRLDEQEGLHRGPFH